MSKKRIVTVSVVLVGLALFLVAPALVAAIPNLPPSDDVVPGVLLEGEEANWMHADFVTQHFYRTLADQVDNVPLDGIEEWRLFLSNMGASSPTVGATIGLTSNLSLVSRPPAMVQGGDPYLYTWDAIIASGGQFDGKVFNPESPVGVTFSPGFGVERDGDTPVFDGPTVWTATIMVQPPSTIPAHTFFHVDVGMPSLLRPVDLRVTAEILDASVTPAIPVGQMYCNSDQAGFELFDDPDSEYTFTVTMLVRPLVDSVAYKPLVRTAHYHAETVEADVTPAVESIAHAAPNCGTWEVVTDQVCTWDWRETIDHVVVLTQYVNSALPVAVPTVEPYVAPVGSEFVFDGAGSYDPDGEIVSYAWDLGDGTTSAEAEVPHSYNEAGVYEVQLAVTDNDGATVTESLVVVVYDPDGGFVTGGGWINSPEGAYTENPSLTGKASFGFVSKYKKGADIPTGQTEFRFKAGDLNFHSDSYDWLVVAGAKAKFKGVGTINGSGAYKFMLTGIDADINTHDSFDIDRFRIKIWEETDGVETVVYDNALGDDSDEATTEIGGGSIKVHK